MTSNTPPPLGPQSPAETKERLKKAGRFIGDFAGFAFYTWRSLLLIPIAVWYCWTEKFWNDSVMRFTCPLLLFLLSLPILDYFGFSFAALIRRKFSGDERAKRN